MKDRYTGQPRGFGFITYADPSVVDKVIEDTHVINGKQVRDPICFVFLTGLPNILFHLIVKWRLNLFAFHGLIRLITSPFPNSIGWLIFFSLLPPTLSSFMVHL